MGASETNLRFRVLGLSHKALPRVAIGNQVLRNLHVGGAQNRDTWRRHLGSLIAGYRGEFSEIPK